MTPLDHTKGGSRAGLMEQRSKDLSGVYKNPDILSSEKSDSATDVAISKRLIREILFESAINKKERIFCSGFAGSKPAGLQKISLCFNDKRLYEICQDSLFRKSRFHCRFITLAVPFQSLRIACRIRFWRQKIFAFCKGRRKCCKNILL